MKKDLRNTRNSLLRLSLLWLLAVVAATAWAAQKTVVHSFADVDIYGNKTAQLYFADPSATDIPAAATNLGLSLDLCADVRLTFVYDPTKVTGTYRPRVSGTVSAESRKLIIVGNKQEDSRVRLVFSSPTGAKIKSLRIDAAADMSYLNHTTRMPGEANTLLLVDGTATTTGATFATNGTSINPTQGAYFLWEGDASTVELEKTTGGTVKWEMLSFTVVYETDDTRAQVPTITASPAPFFTTSRVTISSGEQGATFYYTTDGSTPTETSNRYTAPFTISKTTTVKAIATISGKKNSGVATATFEQLNVRKSINDLLLNAKTSITEYVQLNKAVVTWVNADTFYLQDPTAHMQSGLRLIGSGNGNIELEEGDEVTGLLQGYYAPNRNEMTLWKFVDESNVTILTDVEAPVAEVELDDIASATAEVSSTPLLTDKDYLYQRVQLIATVNSLKASNQYGLGGDIVANALAPGDEGVQIILPDADIDVVEGGRYAFTGVLYDHVAKVNASYIGFRTLHVVKAAHITSPEGLPLGALRLDRYSARLLVDDEMQISIVSKSHEAPISYASSNESVATVDAKGMIRAVGTGEATISVTLASDGTKGSAMRRISLDVYMPAYQLANCNFTEWEDVVEDGGYSWMPVTYEGSEPVGWNGYVGMAASNSQLQRNDDGSVRLLAATVEGAHYPGILTTARHYTIPQSATYTQLLNEAFVYDTEATATQFTGLPDALRVVVKGSLTANNARVGAVLYTPGTMTFPMTDLSETTLAGTEGTVIATALKADIGSSDDWQTIDIPFSYAITGQRPAYAIVSIVTCNEPATGTASTYKDDYLDVKSISFVYNTEPTATIGQLTIDNQHVATYVAQRDVLFPSFIDAYIAESTSGESVVLKRVEEAKAGEAVILIGQEGTYGLKNATGSLSTHESNLLRVSDGQTATGTGIYVLGATNGTQAAFHRYTGAASLSEGRVYLKTDDATARSLDISFASDEQATLDVKPIADKHTSQTAGIYDLQGRKLNAASRKGVYVAIMTDGSCRKIFVK